MVEAHYAILKTPAVHFEMANPLANIFGGNVFNFLKKDSSVLGVDIGSSSIKIVQLRKKNGAAVLETYGELSLGGYADVEIGRATNLPAEKLVEALNDVIKESNVSTKNAGFSIPFSASLISLIKMPGLDERQLKNMIPIEARKYIPVPITEVALDWFVLPEEGQRFFSSEDEGEKEKEEQRGKYKKINVLLVAIHKETLSKYDQIVRGTGLTNSFFEIEIFSTIRSSIVQSTTPTMIIDMGAATTKLYVVEYGIIRSSHIINKGSQDITLSLSHMLGISVSKAEETKREIGLGGQAGAQSMADSTLLVLEYIFSEAKRSVFQYEQNYHRNIGQVLLVGGGALLKGLTSYAQKQFETNVSLGLPFAKTQAPAFLEQVLLDTGPSFSVSVGIALRKLQEMG